jgi:hypothetical protein
MSWVPPRRVTSSPTSVSVVNPSAMTTLAMEASLTTPGTFRAFEGAGLRTQTPHYYTGNLVDVTQDGAANANTAIDWCSRGCYDPVRKRVQTVGTGQGGNGLLNTNWRNTHTVFDETLDGGVGRWSATWGFVPPGSNTVEIMHQLCYQALDYVNRRYYRGKYHEGVVMICDMDTMEWIGSIAQPPSDNFSRDYALDYIPTIGERGAIWAWVRRNSGFEELWQKLIPPVSEEKFLPTAEVAPYTWTQLITNGWRGSYDGRSMPMSYNPRSNKVFCGGRSYDEATSGIAFIVDCANPTVSGVITVDTTPMTRYWRGPHEMHICTDPVNDGWIYFANTGRMWRIRADGTFSDIGQGPGIIGTPGNIADYQLFSIDPYDVIWIIGGTYYFRNEPSRGWLYKPAAV